MSLEASWVGAQKAQMPVGMDMVVDGYVVSPHIVAEWAITPADVVHLSMIDGHMFMESDQTHYLTLILFSGQTFGILTRIIDHGKGQLSDQDVPSTRNLAGFWEGHLHGLSGQGFESSLIFGTFYGQVFLDVTSTLFQMFCHFFYGEDVSIEETVWVGLSPLLIHELQFRRHIHVGITSPGKV